VTAVLDSTALTRFATQDRTTLARITRLRDRGLWPPIVPTAVLVESITGRGPRDAKTNRLLNTCEVVDLGESLARRAARLRTLARQGSAVDAIVVATAEDHGSRLIITGDKDDLSSLAQHASSIEVLRI
jgi:PIN domain.